MSKNTFFITFFIILLIIFISAFSSSYVSHNLDNLAYVLAIGIDKGESAKLKVSTQFTKTAVFSSGGGSSSEDSSNIVLVSGEADSIFSALNLINSYIGREVNLAHCSIITFSEELAKEGISSEIYSLMNHQQIRPTANVVITKSTAYEYLKNSKPNLEKLTTQYYDTFAITSKFTGYISNLTIGNFFDELSNELCDTTAIFGGLNSKAKDKENSSSSEEDSSGSSSEDSSSSGESSNSSNESSNDSSEQNSSSSSESSNSSEQNQTTNPNELIAGSSTISNGRGTENIGIAVFNKDKLCGELTVSETISHLLINNKIDTCIISIDNPLKEGVKMEVQLIPAKKCKKTTSIKDDKLIIDVDLTLDANVITLAEGIDYESNEVLNKISNAVKDYLSNEINNYFNKVSNEYGVDIDKFCLNAQKYFPTKQKLDEFNLKEKYKSAEFNSNINIDVISSLLLTKT